jgi:type IV pilus assembly protein PilE
MRKARGFTLIEILVTVAIVAILAAFAIPNYSRYVTRGKLVQAADELANLRIRMEQYYQDNKTYLNGAACGVPNPADRSDAVFTYSCTGTAATYVWTATGKAAKGMGGFVYSIDQANTRQTVSWPSSFGTVPSAGADSWVFQ